MSTFEININPPKDVKSINIPDWLIFLVGVLFTLRSAAHFESSDYLPAVFHLMSASFFYMIYFLKRKGVFSYKFRIDENRIRAKIPHGGKFLVNRSEIKFIKIKTIRIDFIQPDLSVKVLNLANVEAEQIFEIKTALRGTAAEWNIPIDDGSNSGEFQF